MIDGSLRRALRENTQDVHTALDALGTLYSIDDYKCMLQAAHQFRRHIEPKLSNVTGWPLDTLIPALEADIGDLDLSPESYDPAPVAVEGYSAQIGALYVLEGSTLGAKLLFRRARQIGLSAEFGARHLDRQANGGARWPQFLQLLDRADDIDQADAIAAAQVVFASAYDIYSKAFNGRPQPA